MCVGYHHLQCVVYLHCQYKQLTFVIIRSHKIHSQLSLPFRAQMSLTFQSEQVKSIFSHITCAYWHAAAIMCYCQVILFKFINLNLHFIEIMFLFGTINHTQNMKILIIIIIIDQLNDIAGIWTNSKKMWEIPSNTTTR